MNVHSLVHIIPKHEEEQKDTNIQKYIDKTEKTRKFRVLFSWLFLRHTLVLNFRIIRFRGINSYSKYHTALKSFIAELCDRYDIRSKLGLIPRINLSPAFAREKTEIFGFER